MYIYEQNKWPNFTWNSDKLLEPLSIVRCAQGKLLGKLEIIGFENLDNAIFETLTLDIIKSSEIEGEILSREQVRSSLARKLGIDLPNQISSSRDVDGIVELTLEAVQNFNEQLTEERLFSWHSALFPSGRSGLYKIATGKWRDGLNGPMQVVFGIAGREKVHFEAPDAQIIPEMMSRFVNWFNSEKELDEILIAGITHLYFVTIHPFEDGNGRIARALSDMLLARADGIPQRFYSMSAQIMNERKEYYIQLERAQRGNMDITSWLVWFLNCLYRSILNSDVILEKTVKKYKYWQHAKEFTLNERQQKMLNLLLDDFKGKLTSSKWAKITKCSTDTALRDIQNLINNGLLKKNDAGGRSSSYSLLHI